MNSDNLKNNLNESEILPAAEQKICDLIGKLDRAECPKNFDFRLKARIASADKKEYQPSPWQTLRYIVPVAACVLVVAFVMVQAGMFSPVNQTGNAIASATNPNIQPLDSQSNEAKIATVSNSAAPEIAAVPNRNNQTNTVTSVNVSLTNSSENRVGLPKISREDEPTMSRDFSVGENIKPLYPKNYDPTKIGQQTQENQDNKSASTKGIFDTIGVETEIVGGKMRIKNIVENSLFDKSGIKVGDIIEAIDNTKIMDNDTVLKSNKMEKVTVSRNGKIIEIRLKSN